MSKSILSAFQNGKLPVSNVFHTTVYKNSQKADHSLDAAPAMQLNPSTSPLHIYALGYWV